MTILMDRLMSCENMITASTGTKRIESEDWKNPHTENPNCLIHLFKVVTLTKSTKYSYAGQISII